MEGRLLLGIILGILLAKRSNKGVLGSGFLTLLVSAAFLVVAASAFGSIGILLAIGYVIAVLGDSGSNHSSP